MNNTELKILALDSTAEVSTVAMCEGEKLLSQITINTGNTHSQTLLPAVEAALNFAELAVDDIDAFACSVGPGSFTGVRIGVATVKGLTFGKDKPCVPISTLEALAYNLVGYNGIICPVMNARRMQVYNALFRCENGVLMRICDDRAISIAELDEELKRYSESIFLCGDGYDISVKGLKDAKVSFVPESLRLQSAYSVARIALKKYAEGKFVSDTQLAPTYLRPSQAERERQAKIDAEKAKSEN